MERGDCRTQVCQLYRSDRVARTGRQITSNTSSWCLLCHPSLLPPTHPLPAPTPGEPIQTGNAEEHIESVNPGGKIHSAFGAEFVQPSESPSHFLDRHFPDWRLTAHYEGWLEATSSGPLPKAPLVGAGGVRVAGHSLRSTTRPMIAYHSDGEPHVGGLLGHSAYKGSGATGNTVFIASITRNICSKLFVSTAPLPGSRSLNLGGGGVGGGLRVGGGGLAAYRKQMASQDIFTSSLVVAVTALTSPEAPTTQAHSFCVMSQKAFSADLLALALRGLMPAKKSAAAPVAAPAEDAT